MSLGDQFELFGPSVFEVRYNIAPTDLAPVVRLEDGHRVLKLLRWGLVPTWAKDLAEGTRAVNARSETLAEKRTFKEAFKARRCIVPASGFYEWKTVGKARVPHFIQRKDGLYLGMAGLWDRWYSPENERIETFTVLTSAANTLVAELHDRMPVVLEAKDYGRWLDPHTFEISALESLLVPASAELFTMRAVDPYVNRAGNEGPRCLDPYRADQLELF